MRENRILRASAASSARRRVRPPALQQRQAAERQKGPGRGEAAEPDREQNQPSDRIRDQAERPVKPRGDDRRQRQHADEAVEQHRIGRLAPAVSGARGEHDAGGVAADRGRQHLIEERRDHAEADRLRLRHRRAAEACDPLPADGAEPDLQQADGDRQDEPARRELVQPLADRVDLDAAGGEVEQCCRYRKFQRKQGPLPHGNRRTPWNRTRRTQSLLLRKCKRPPQKLFGYCGPQDHIRAQRLDRA